MGGPVLFIAAARLMITAASPIGGFEHNLWDGLSLDRGNLLVQGNQLDPQVVA
jgi:hypothetical protein